MVYAMLVCPRCRQRLSRAKSKVGIFHECPQCKGRAIGVPVLRKLLPPRYVRQLWGQASKATLPRGPGCPVCRQPMAEVPVTTHGGEVPLDVCTKCRFVWFDVRELEQLPRQAPPKDDRKQLPEKVREQMALLQIEIEAQKARGSDFGGEQPEEAWKWIPAILGMPVEHDAHPAQSWPWITWGLAAAMVLMFLLTVGNLEPVVLELVVCPL